MKSPQTTFAPTFLTHIIARIDGVSCTKLIFNSLYMPISKELKLIEPLLPTPIHIMYA